MMDLWMQIEGTKLTFIMNFSVLDAPRMPQIAQILALTFKIFWGACPGPDPHEISFLFFMSNSSLWTIWVNKILREEFLSRLRDCLVGLVVRRSPRERKIPGSNPACAGIFSRSSHTSDSKIGTPVATLPGAWRYRVSAGTGWPGVSILSLGEVERLICNLYLSVAARKIVWADPSLRYTSMLLGR